MTNPADAQSLGISELSERISRLEQRLARERGAREEAEHIAERGMRDLWETNRDLERRVAERTAELEQSLSSATMAAAAKERFLADLGHELTTPLHAVLGLLELIDFTTLAEDDLARIHEVQHSAATLSELLRGLIDLAGATGPPGVTDVSTGTAASWIDNAIEGWTLSAAMKGQLLVPTVVGGDEPISVDWRRLDRIMKQVVDNANQHGDSGTIEIAVNVAPETIEVNVTDSGPGISDEAVATVFEPFVKHADGGGVGIGLSIAHRLAVGGGGSLEITSDGTATRVSLTLPRGR